MSNERTEFRWNNESTTNQVQQRFISKLAESLGMPVNLLRAALDVDRAKESNVLHFDVPGLTLHDFYVIHFKLDLNGLWQPETFEDSRFLQEYGLMNARKGTKGALFTVYSSSFYVLQSLAACNVTNAAGLLLDYPPYMEQMILLPLETFFRLHQPYNIRDIEQEG